MSATDWYVCPKCKKKAIAEIAKWYGKVEEKVWQILSELKKAWEDEDGDYEVEQKDIDVLNEVELDGFDYCKFLPSESLSSVRYDSDTGLSDDCSIDMSESYVCQTCGAEWIINKRWGEGTNKEVK